MVARVGDSGPAPEPVHAASATARITPRPPRVHVAMATTCAHPGAGRLDAGIDNRRVDPPPPEPTVQVPPRRTPRSGADVKTHKDVFQRLYVGGLRDVQAAGGALTVGPGAATRLLLITHSIMTIAAPPAGPST